MWIPLWVCSYLGQQETNFLIIYCNLNIFSLDVKLHLQQDIRVNCSHTAIENSNDKSQVVHIRYRFKRPQYLCLTSMNMAIIKFVGYFHYEFIWFFHRSLEHFHDISVYNRRLLLDSKQPRLALCCLKMFSLNVSKENLSWKLNSPLQKCWHFHFLIQSDK